MTRTYMAIFRDSKAAGSAVSELSNKGYTKDVSVVAKNTDNAEVQTHEVKQDVSDGTAVGAATGAALGAVGAILVGAASFVLPGLGLVVLGPLATILSGTAAGAITGGVVGALVDWGVPDEQAKDYEERIMRGEVLVAVTAGEDKEMEINQTFNKYGAEETYSSKSTKLI